MRISAPFLFALLLSVAACNTDYTPKPRGYMRIALPEKTYHNIETDCPYSFEIADYSQFIQNPGSLTEPCWFDVSYPQFKAKLHFSYKPLKGNLAEFLEDSRTLTNKHISQASNIEESVIIKDDTRVFGTIFFVEGSRAASPVQFHVTDSTDHFLRAALYFNVTPNNDSLAPVIDFLEQDILHIIETLEWKS
ncbi:MAG: gliding motility lipoprotein GldD [Flavobacteriales bacterium]|nr:gliding motility lipoprotein GldD [Flavobacteriales bacterium]